MEIDHDLVGRLPERVRAEAARYMAARDYDSLVKLLDEQPADPVVLLCVAWARTMWATEVMVDRLRPDAERALAEVGQARRAGAQARDADPVERFVRAMLDHEQERQRVERLSEQAAAAGPAGPTAEQLRSRAHRAWDARRYDEAAALFRDAARQQVAEGRTGEFNDEIRAGLCLANAGRHDEARPVLEQALVYAWADAGIWEDRHMSEHASMALLRPAAHAGADEFNRVWERAVACSVRLEREFPSIHPFQAELLDLTMRLGLPGHCRRVLERIRARSGRLDAATRAKVQAAEGYLTRVGG
jgi:tetratricopeptide (TPR) repeat protein